MDSSWPAGGGSGSETDEIIAKLIRDLSSPGNSHVQVYTSARFVQHFIAGNLLRPAQEDCETHELLLLPSQSGKPSNASNLEVVSCICNKCYHHFRIKATTNSAVPFSEHHTLGMHMFVEYGRDSEKLLKATRAGDDHVIDRAHFICLVDDCHYQVDLERLPPRLSIREVESLGDRQRVARNLEEARSRELERVQALGPNWHPDVFAMLKKYLSDGIESDLNIPPKKIKVHNKMFMIAFKDDFDDLLRTIGCVKTRLQDGDDAWVFPVLESPSSPTNLGTLRAKWEDVEAECMLFTEPSGNRKIRPAWDLLQRVLACNYESTIGTPKLKEPELALLGCLANFKPNLFVEAARLLAEKCPPRWREFVDAARELIGSRDEDALMSLIMYQSEVEQRGLNMNADIKEAYKFFGIPFHRRDANEFITEYHLRNVPDLSELNRLRLLQNLRTVSDYLEIDLVARVLPDGVEAPQDSGNSKMNTTQAQAILGADLDYPEEILQDIVNHKAQDTQVDRAKVAEALEFFAQHHRSSKPELADKLDNWAGIFKSTNPLAQYGASSQSAQQAPLDPDTPPGLRNIGNTCYLNSLLQYTYTVNPIRDLVLQYPRDSLELSAESVGQRRLGYGNGINVTIEDAIIGQQFTELLRVLYIDLQTTTQIASEPPQKLANTALRSASELLKLPIQQQPEVQPPPLPARPSPVPPGPLSTDTNNVSVTIEPVNDLVETASAVSSQTLVNDDAAVSTEPTLDVNGENMHSIEKPALNDVVMTTEDAKSTNNVLSADLPLNEKMRIIGQKLEQSDRKGTDQQDVEEIIGFILEHLMRAIKSLGPMPGKPDLQADIITNTFFSLVVNYTMKSDESPEKARIELNPDRWINAFPDSKAGVSSSIHQALDRSFGLQYVGSDIARYSAIRTLSPIIHIRIQRANATSTGATKNNNPVVLTDVLYLDRYMDVPGDSELAAMRREHWALQGHQIDLSDVDGDVVKTSTPTAAPAPADTDHRTNDLMADDDMPHYTMADLDDEAVDTLLKELPIRFQGTPQKRKLESHELPGVKKRSASPHATDKLISRVTDILAQPLIGKEQNVSTEQQNGANSAAQKRVEAYYDTLTQHKYRLHAVICHSGGARAGHYWVWIRDFSRNVWIKFNDSTVTVDSREPQAVIDELNRSGDPCYVAYVRDEDKDSIVAIPQRTPIVNENTTSENNGGFVDVQTIEGVAPADIDMPDLIPPDKHTVTDSGIMEMIEPRPYDLDT